jgi:archaemetzincin
LVFKNTIRRRQQGGGKRKINAVSEIVMTIEIHILPFAGVAMDDVGQLVQELAASGIQARVLPETAMSPEAYNPHRRQYNAGVLLNYTRRARKHLPILGVTGADLYAEGLNFVFGLAESPGKAAVISLRRLHSGTDDALFRARAVKEAVHELGHTFGLGHCTNPRCVMYFSNSLADTDRKGRVYCPKCRDKMMALT